MSDFEKWFEDQDFYTNMRFIHGDKLFDKDGDVYRILPVQMTYQGWSEQRQRSKDEFVELTQEWHAKGWNARQGEIDDLKAQLNNMETCYIEKKKQAGDQHKKVDEALFEMRQLSLILSEDVDGYKDPAQICQSEGVDMGVKILEKALRGAND